MPDISFDEDIQVQIEQLVEHEQVFLDRENQLHRALDSAKEQTSITENEIFNELNIALSGAVESSEEFTSAVFGYMRLIIERRNDTADLLYEFDASDELVKSILNTVIEYGREYQRLTQRQTQGKNWWSFVDTDTVLDDGAIRHIHRITIDQSREVEIHSSPFSDWILLRHFLSQIMEAYSILNEDNLSVVDIEEFNQIRASLYYLEEELSTREEEIPLPNRSELLDNMDISTGAE